MIKSSSLKNIFILFFVFSLFSSCSSYKPVEIGDVQGMKIDKISAASFKFKILVPIKNPNPFSIKITHYNLDLQVNDQKLGNVESSVRIVIPAKSDMVHELPAEIAFKGFFSSATIALIKIFRNKEIVLKAKGNMDIKAMFLKRTIEVDETQTISIINN